LSFLFPSFHRYNTELNSIFIHQTT
jgi:hypothetical protein